MPKLNINQIKHALQKQMHKYYVQCIYCVQYIQGGPKKANLFIAAII